MMPIEKAHAERPDTAIMLSHYKRGLDRKRQLMYLSLMITEVNDFFNVKGNMNENQIILTAELILDNDNFYDLTLGNIKACFRDKMANAKLYDRLDGNLIIGWLKEFKSEMADYCELTREGQDKMELQEESGKDAGVISHSVYMTMLEARANDGDEEAKRILGEYRRRSKIPSEEEQHKKELEFFKYKAEYDKRRQEMNSAM